MYHLDVILSDRQRYDLLVLLYNEESEVQKTMELYSSVPELQVAFERYKSRLGNLQSFLHALNMCDKVSEGGKESCF